MLSSLYYRQRLVLQSINKFRLLRTMASSSSITDKFAIPERYKGGERSVWVEYIQLALEHKPVANLGQGFPDFAAPEHVSKALSDATTDETNVLLNQYTRGFGHPRLVQVLSKVYSGQIGREINPMTEILVTAGAYEGLFCAILGHTSPGDEVIIIEPYFDCYEPMVRAAGGIPRFIPLKPREGAGESSEDWVLDPEELKSMFGPKTKSIILNTPHNPIGKVFTHAELEQIADLCKQWNVLCISDEVYEWMVYKPKQHIRIATLPGMWERTVTIGSAGKTFSVTGWKLGWAYGPSNLINNLQTVHQNTVYTCTTPTQEAVARGLEFELSRQGQPDCYFTSLAEELLPKRDMMAQFLRDVGMKPVIPDGGYFMIADWSPLSSRADLSKETDAQKDYKFTKWMTKTLGLQGIPPSAFYSGPHKYLAEDYVRYCFIKRDEVLQKAADILHKWKAS